MESGGETVDSAAPASRQNETNPIRTLTFNTQLPEERISPECLSLTGLGGGEQIAEAVRSRFSVIQSVVVGDYGSFFIALRTPVLANQWLTLLKEHMVGAIFRGSRQGPRSV